MSDRKYPIRYYKKSHHYSADMNVHRDREAFALILEGGAIEGWRAEASGDSGPFPSRYFGGVEIHSREPQHSKQEPSQGYCELVNGPCYHDGSSLAFEQIEYLFDAPAAMYRTLHQWEPDEWRNDYA